MANPLLDDRLVALLFDAVLDVPALCRLPYFAQYWIATEVPRVDHLLGLCRGEDSCARMQPDWY